MVMNCYIADLLKTASDVPILPLDVIVRQFGDGTAGGECIWGNEIE